MREETLLERAYGPHLDADQWHRAHHIRKFSTSRNMESRALANIDQDFQGSGYATRRFGHPRNWLAGSGATSTKA